jgi:hypothetical protein
VEESEGEPHEFSTNPTVPTVHRVFPESAFRIPSADSHCDSPEPEGPKTISGPKALAIVENSVESVRYWDSWLWESILRRFDSSAESTIGFESP